MTPEERNLVTALFDRLAALEDAPRDRDAERMIQDGLRQAPNASYTLVQTVLVQEEALKRADARIQALEAELAGNGAPPRPNSFLGPRPDGPWGHQHESHQNAPRAGSVPTVRPAGMGVPPGYRAEAPPAGAEPAGQPPAGSGGSFLGTAAAAAAGLIGGSLLLGGIRSMMGQQGGGAHAAADPSGGGASPWAGTGGSGDLARQAGLDDIGRGAGGRGDAGRGHGLLDGDATAAAATDDNDDAINIADDEDLGDFTTDFEGEDE